MSKGKDLKFRSFKIPLFVFCSFIVLCPILITPVIADDYINPFSQVSKSGNGFLVSLADCIHTVFSGASFRLVGVPLGGLFNWLTLQMSGRFQIDFWITYAGTKFLIFLFVCLAAKAIKPDEPPFQTPHSTKSPGILFLMVSRQQCQSCLARFTLVIVWLRICSRPYISLASGKAAKA